MRLVTYQSDRGPRVAGLRGDQLVDLKALIGDKSDNVPGVAGSIRPFPSPRPASTTATS